MTPWTILPATSTASNRDLRREKHEQKIEEVYLKCSRTECCCTVITKIVKGPKHEIFVFTQSKPEWVNDLKIPKIM
jgi:hypothetical protein